MASRFFTRFTNLLEKKNSMKKRPLVINTILTISIILVLVITLVQAATPATSNLLKNDTQSVVHVLPANPLYTNPVNSSKSNPIPTISPSLEPTLPSPLESSITFPALMIPIPTQTTSSLPDLSTDLMPTPTPTVTLTPISTPTLTLSPTPSPQPTSTPTASISSQTPSYSPIPTANPTANPTPTPSPIPTSTPTPTPIPTPIPTSTPAPTPAPTPTPDPKPTPTPTPSRTDSPTSSQSENLITGSNDWYPYETSPNSYSVNIHLDNSVELVQGQPSIRIDQHTSKDSNSAREADSKWIAVSPGEEIIFSCWIKTSASSLGYNGATGYGARIGCDFYGSGYITGISWNGAYTTQPTYQQVVNNFVNWNTDEWTLKTIDFVVPQTVYDSSGVGHIPTGIIPWLQVSLPNDQGSAWFAEAALYIING